MFSNLKREYRYNMRLAVPIMLGQLGHVLVAFVDNVMVGALGPEALAAVSLGNTFIYIALSLGLGFSFAITPLVAEADAQADHKQARSYLKHGFYLNLMLGLSLCVAVVVAAPILKSMNQPPVVVELAVSYMQIVAFSLVPLMLFQSFKQFTDGKSETKLPLYASIAANVVNVLLNYLLIYGVWFVPAMGVDGAALATLISRVLMLAGLWIVLMQVRKMKFYILTFSKAAFHKKTFKTIMHQGIPTALQMFFEVLLFTSAIFIAGYMGVVEQAANQITLNLATTTFMVAVGLSVTATIRVGNQKGKKNFAELRRVAQSIFSLVLVVMFCFAIILYTLKSYLPFLYTQDLEVAALATQLLIVAALFQLSDG
ncbi:MAG: MATE family efflux transporter, partial [Flavobacteriaceae bacterium]|nr:MATE family efflux transporter [Flavobacteriaceae bacterium]